MPRHPMQRMYRDRKGTLRFRENRIVRYLLDHGPIDLNQIADMPFSKADRAQFCQLIGYSVYGYCEVSEGNRKAIARAHRIASRFEMREARAHPDAPSEKPGDHP